MDEKVIHRRSAELSKLPQIFRLKSTPSGPMVAWEAVTTTWVLLGDKEEFVLQITCRLGRKRKVRRVEIGPRQATNWIEAIRSSKVSLLPAAIPTCDGSHYEFLAADAGTSVCLTWYNVPPEGAESLDDLVERLWDFVTPDLGFSEKECLEMPIFDL